MQRTNEDCLDRCIASNSDTSTHETSESLSQLQKKFKVEKDAKNRAYCFILSKGLLADYAHFVEENYSSDYHKKNLNLLIELLDL